MAYRIDSDLCTSCEACAPPVCPNDAISVEKSTFVIDESKCSECEGHYDMPQCVEVCPIEDCIVPV